VGAELDSQASVRNAASMIQAKFDKIDIVINCADIMAVKEYKKSVDGIELQFATNHIGHFLLTNLLMDGILAAGEGARIVNVSSDGYAISAMRLDDYNFQVCTGCLSS
jgi:NAD(P)-dependent dehydrogenase (short-subunit alcohol dehydrogenase family)